MFSRLLIVMNKKGKTTKDIILSKVFAPIVYLDSSSLGELARLKRRVEEGGGKMALCNVSSTLHEILTVILFDKLFTIFDDQASATAWISTDDSDW